MERPPGTPNQRQFLAGVGGGAVLAADPVTGAGPATTSDRRDGETVAVVVRFATTEADDAGADGVGIESTASDRAGRAPFRRYAERTDGVAIARECWIADAALDRGGWAEFDPTGERVDSRSCGAVALLPPTPSPRQLRSK